MSESVCMLLNPDRPLNDLRLELEYDLDADTGDYVRWLRSGEYDR